MGIESLYANDIEAGIQRQLLNPTQGPGSSFRTTSFVAAGVKGIPAAGLQVGGSALDVLAPAAAEVARRPRLKVLENQPDDRDRVAATAKFVTEGGDVMREEASSFAPDPATSHTADQVLYGFTRVGTKVVAATAVGNLPAAATLLAAEGTNTAYHELVAKGIDPATALKAGAVEGLGQAAAVIPMAGPTIKATVGLGIAAGPGTFMAQETLSRKILAEAGYKDEASRHDPLDPLGLTIATLLPAVFGSAHAVGLARARPTLADVVLSNESGGKRYGADGALLTSPKGAQGEMQVMPKTATDPGYGVIPAKDGSPEELARVGRDYLSAMEHRYQDPAMAMAAYNAGPGAVDKALLHGGDWLAHLPDETQKYVEKGMKKLGDKTVAHAAADPEAVDAARVRTTQDALHRSMPDVMEAPAAVMRASDFLAAGEQPRVKPLTDYSDFFADMVPKFDVPAESQATMRPDERGMPEIRTAGISLTDAHPVSRMEHVADAANPGEQLTRFAIRDPEGNVMGHTDLLLKDGKVVSLYDVETTQGLRGRGVGAKVIEAITSLEPDRKVEISNIVDDAVPFWEKVGAQVSDGNRSPTLDWHQFADSPAGRARGAARRSESVAEHPQAVDTGATGRDASSPQGGDARELTPEEAAAFGFHADNMLPPPEQVRIEPEATVKAAEPPKPIARAEKVAAESPDMLVQLPGSDRSVTVAEALKQAKDQHALELTENDLVKAALECALGYGG